MEEKNEETNETKQDEDKSQNLIEERKAKIKNIFKNNDIMLSAILIFALIVRLYFLQIAKNQTHWWDSLAYGGIAKNIIYHTWDSSIYVINEAIIRPPLLPYFWSMLLRINASDAVSLFFLQILPSLASVFFLFLIIKEFYGKKVAYLASFILSVSWIHLFYSVRMMTDVPSFFFSLVSIYFFVKSYNKFDTKNFSLSILFLTLAFLTRYVYAILGVIYIVFLLIHHKQKLFKKKKFYISGLLGSILLILFLLFNLITKGSILPATTVYSEGAEKVPFAFHALGLFSHILQSVFLPFFIVGLAIVAFTIFIGFGRISKIKILQAHVFNLLLLFICLIYFIFFLRAAEDRYLFIIFLPMLSFISLGAFSIYDFIKKHSKIIAIIFILALTIWGGYQQLKFADTLIASRVNSYVEMKEAFQWVKQNTPPDAVFLGMGVEPYAIFYADRPVEAWPQEDFDNNVESVIANSDYVVVNLFHPSSEEILNYVNGELQSKLETVYVAFIDEAQTQPSIIISKIIKEDYLLVKDSEADL